MRTHDVVIVGAGSAGCVLASRLTEIGRHTVLRPEAGGHYPHLRIWMPVGYGLVSHDRRVNLKNTAEPDPGALNRVRWWPRGKADGGAILDQRDGLSRPFGSHVQSDDAVIDASVFPAATSGNTNALTKRVAKKGADMILTDHAGS